MIPSLSAHEAGTRHLQGLVVTVNREISTQLRKAFSSNALLLTIHARRHTIPLTLASQRHTFPLTIASQRHGSLSTNSGSFHRIWLFLSCTVSLSHSSSNQILHQIPRPLELVTLRTPLLVGGITVAPSAFMPDIIGKRVYLTSFSTHPGTNPPESEPSVEPQVFSREEVDSLLPTIGTPESLQEAMTRDPKRTFQLLHSTFHYRNFDLAARDTELVRLTNIYDQHEIESSQRQEQLEATINNQSITMTGYQKQIQDLNHSLDRARLSPQRPQSGAHPSSLSRSAKFPDPPAFDGTRAKLDAFIFKLKSKLEANADWYLTPEAEINYAYGRLEGKAEKQILPWMDSKNAACIKEMNAFYEALRLCFEDPDKKWKAQQFIDNLRQGERPFSEYLSQFQSHIGDTGFGKATQLYYFKNGLSNELLPYLSPIDTEAMDMDQLIMTCHRLDNSYRQLQQRGY